MKVSLKGNILFKNLFKFLGIQGFEMRMVIKFLFNSIVKTRIFQDQQGNALGNYTLLSLQKVKPIMNKSHPDYYPMEYAMDVAGDFVTDLDNPKGLPKLRIKHEVGLKDSKIIIE